MHGDDDTPNSGLAGVFAQHRAELIRFLVARCGQADAGEDLLQDLWIKASHSPTGPIANPRAYLFRMANNLVLDQARARQRSMARDRAWLAEGAGGDEAVDLRPDPAPGADEALAVKQELAALEQAIAALPAGAQRALRLHRLEGHGQAEVAQIMGISRSGVEKHLATAMKHLRKSLGDCGLFAAVPSGDQVGTRGGEPRLEQQQ